MKRVEVVKANEVEVKPFILSDFIQSETASIPMKKVSKNELKDIAKELGMDYDEANITFAKKLINVYIKRHR